MKAYVLLVSFFFTVLSETVAAEYTDGYIISLANDTVRCKIRLEGMESYRYELYNRVEVLDSAGNKVIYRPGQKAINGFGFMYKEKPQVYKPFDEGPYSVFELQEETGNRLNLYYYVESGYRSSLRVFSLENKNGEHQKIRYNVLSDWKGKVLKFLKDDPGLQKLAGETIQEFDDIKTFVVKANAQG